MVRESLDVRDDTSCYAGNRTLFDPTFPDKIEFLGFGEGKYVKTWKITKNVKFKNIFNSSTWWLLLYKSLFLVFNLCKIFPHVVIYDSAFSLIMFAYAGSASFPTYQQDMKNRGDFPKAVMAAMSSNWVLIFTREYYLYSVLICLYIPMAAVGYFQLGKQSWKNKNKSWSDPDPP